MHATRSELTGERGSAAPVNPEPKQNSQHLDAGCAAIPRQGLDAELSERAECTRPEASARVSAEALHP